MSAAVTARRADEDLVGLGIGRLLDVLVLRALVIRTLVLPTFAIANSVRMEGYLIDTRTVRRALDALEQYGAIERVTDIGTRPIGNVYWRRKYWRPRLVHSRSAAHGT